MVSLIEHRFFLVGELSVLEIVSELICPMCPDRDFNETECFQQERAEPLVKQVACSYYVERSTCLEQRPQAGSGRQFKRFPVRTEPVESYVV